MRSSRLERRCALLNAAFCGIALLSNGANGAVIYVDVSAAGGQNNGLSWRNAFIDLRSALAIAQIGDEIRIGQGTYRPAPPNGPRDASFNLVDGVTLRGGYAGFGAPDPDANDPDLFVTTLSGDLNGDDFLPPNFTNHGENSFHVITAFGVRPPATLANLVVSGGYAMEFKPPENSGGGIYAKSSVIVLDRVIIENNAAKNSGGGIYAVDSFLPSTIHMKNCVVRGNRTPTLAASGSGAGVCAGPGSTFEDCLFLNNRCGAGKVAGGLIASHVRLLRCDFMGNSGEDGGGAILHDSILIGCRFIGNLSSFHGAAARISGQTYVVNCRFHANDLAYEGGAIYINESPHFVHMYNCLFTGNRTADAGGGAILNRGRLRLTNCTIVGNKTTGHFGEVNGAVQTIDSGETHFINSIVWGNICNEQSTFAAQVGTEGAGQVSFQYSTVQGLPSEYAAINNSSEDPSFIDADGVDNVYGTLDDNPRLQSNSVARDTGSQLYLPSDIFDLDEDGIFAELLPWDLDARRRIVNGQVDRGCFEFQTCPGDVAPLPSQGDGSVDISDLLAVISTWGACDSPCPTDIQPDGVINVSDLLAVILGWGACP